MKEQKCCPYCNGTTGFHDVSLNKAYLGFDWEGKQIDYDYEEFFYKQLKRKICIDCGRTVPRKIIREILGEEE